MLLVDETPMGEGRLSETGMTSFEALSTLVQQQVWRAIYVFIIIFVYSLLYLIIIISVRPSFEALSTLVQQQVWLAICIFIAILDHYDKCAAQP